MVKLIKKRIFPTILAISLLISALPLALFAATTVEPLTGRIQVTDSVGTGTLSGGTVTITTTGGTISKTTNTITVKNTSGVTGTITFNYTISGQDSYTGFQSTSGEYSKLFAADEVATFTIVAPRFKKTATLTLTSFNFAEATSNVNVNFEYDSSCGSITVDSKAVASGNAFEVAPATSMALVATPASNAKFLGWINAEDNKILSLDKSYNHTATQDATIKAIFTTNTGKPYFLVEDKYLFDDLNAAANKAAASSSNKTVVLMNDATLPAGNYTIPSGATLLIPFDDANTLYTTTPKSCDADNTVFGFLSGTPQYVVPTVYRQLNMASGANITVNGAISLSAKHFNANGANRSGGSPTGPCSYIYMNENSTITVNSGANLYAWGFIYGKGNVTIKSGGHVYENFQIEDFRGGDQTTELTADGNYGIFPVAAYYIQNIEVPLTIEAGAIETCYTSIVISRMIQSSNVEFFAKSGAMFNLTSGSVTKYYDGSTDRLYISLNGDMTVSPLELNVGGTNINSKNFDLPVNSNISIEVNEGSNIYIEQDLALLPGTEINIAKDATATLAEGVSMYVYDNDDWGGYISPANLKFREVQYAPGRTYKRTEADLKDALIQIDGTIDAKNGFVYVTKGGANVVSSSTGKVIINKGSQEITYQVIQASDPTNSTYVEISLISPVLKNADSSVLQSKTNTYVYTNGFWRCETHTDLNESDWVLVKEPTYSIEGSEHQNCNHCGGEAAQSIPTISVPDVDGDGSLTALDLVKLKKIILGTDTLPENVYSTISDLNDDKKVNILDLITIKMFLLEMI